MHSNIIHDITDTEQYAIKSDIKEKNRAFIAKHFDNQSFISITLHIKIL